MRSQPTFNEEKILWKKGYDFVIGLDEVGRGAFAGPVTVGAVVFPKNSIKIANLGINDSKLLSANKREELSKEIKKHTLHWSVATIGVPIINKFRIGKATQMAFRKAIRSICHSDPEHVEEEESHDVLYKASGDPSSVSRRTQDDIKRTNPIIFVLIDGFHVRYIKGIGLKNQKAIIKGDQKSISIAAASIIAKVHRDNLMKKLHKKFPHYNFAKNKGYGTKEHREALKAHGLSSVHRSSFALKKFTPHQNGAGFTASR